MRAGYVPILRYVAHRLGRMSEELKGHTAMHGLQRPHLKARFSVTSLEVRTALRVEYVARELPKGEHAAP